MASALLFADPALEQELENDGPWAKSGLRPVFMAMELRMVLKILESCFKKGRGKDWGRGGGGGRKREEVTET